MKLPSVFGAFSALTLFLSSHASAQFETIWVLGEDNGSQTEFSQEQGQQNLIEDGDSTILDDDYYFQGTTDAFGLVAFDEDWSTFERALTSGDPRVRIHFLLSPEEAAASTNFNLVVDFVQLGGGSSHDVRILFNESEVFSQSGIDADLLVDQTFLGATVSPVPGHNVITVERTGGGTANPWIQFDYLELLAETNTGTCPDPVCSFSADKTFIQPGDAVKLTFLANTASQLEIDNGVGTVTVDGEGIGSTTVNPTETTTYLLMANLNGTVVTREVTVEVDVIRFFDAAGSPPLADPSAPAGSPVSRPGQPVTLSWVLADPAASVEIDNGVGNVDANTNAQGVGSIVLEGALAPAAFTTYTITATRGGDVETLTVDVDVDEFSLMWQIGRDDQTQGDFAQEAGGENDPDAGDSLALDDDYYFAGTDDSFDAVTETEPWNQFERAITSGDPNVRIHFLMDAEQAASGNFLNLTLDMFAGGSANDGWGIHDLSVTFNDVEVFSQTGVDGDLLIEAMFTTDTVGAVDGQNVVEVSRTAGTSASWIQFDYLTLELNADPSECIDPVCDFTASTNLVAPGETASLSWFVAPSATVTIDNGVGDVTGLTAGGFGSVEVTPVGNTTYTITSNNGGTIGTMSVTVDVLLLSSFTAEGAVPLSDPLSRPGQPAKLMWSVDPTASVSIDNGIGSVDAQTVGGIGSLDVSPTAETTYTLTATRGADTETAQVTVGVSGWQLLWQIGRDDATQTDFSQENTGNERPGDHLGQDDDFYTPGNYTSHDPVIGNLPLGEPWVNFDRALTNGDPNNRIHFIMTADQAAADNEIRLFFDMDFLGGGDGARDHDISVFFNGNEVITEAGIAGPTFLEATVRAGDVGAEAGHNEVEVSRTGGEGGWIQFDMTSGEVRAPVVEEGDLNITEVSFDDVLGGLSVTWTSQGGKSYRIETSSDLKSWTTAQSGIGAALGQPTTSSTIDLGIDHPGRLYVRVVEE